MPEEAFIDRNECSAGESVWLELKEGKNCGS